MKRALALVVAVLGVMLLAGSVAAKPPSITTINLRTCVDGGNGACLSGAGDLSVDGTVVCLQPAGGAVSCATTEDGEYWIDSLPHGKYRAWVEVPDGYALDGITCTTFPDTPYAPCNVRGTEVGFVVKKELNAVSINFLLVAL